MSVASVSHPVDLESSREHCRRVAKRQAKNFYYGMKLVPEPKRSAMYTLYAWMRRADDLADEPGDLNRKLDSLRSFREQTHRAFDGTSPEGELWPAFRELVSRYPIPRSYFDAMIDGQVQDQEQTRYPTFEQLRDYCYKVASVVGLACIEIWGYEGGESTRTLAEQRGIAFQLTNILRDVREDASRGRVYLPADDFHVAQLTPADLAPGRSETLGMGLRTLAARARDYYERSEPLDRQVHPDGRACLWAMTRIYRGLLDKITLDPTRVLRERVRLSRFRKTTIALRAPFHKGGSL